MPLYRCTLIPTTNSSAEILPFLSQSKYKNSLLMSSKVNPGNSLCTETLNSIKFNPARSDDDRLFTISCNFINTDLKISVFILRSPLLDNLLKTATRNRPNSSSKEILSSTLLIEITPLSPTDVNISQILSDSLYLPIDWYSLKVRKVVAAQHILQPSMRIPQASGDRQMTLPIWLMC